MLALRNFFKNLVGADEVVLGPLDGVRVAVMVAEPKKTHLDRWVSDELKLLGAYAEVADRLPQRGYTLRLGLAECGLDNRIEHKLTWRFLDPQKELVDSGELIEVTDRLADGRAQKELAQKMAGVINSLSPEPDLEYERPKLSSQIA